MKSFSPFNPTKYPPYKESHFLKIIAEVFHSLKTLKRIFIKLSPTKKREFKKREFKKREFKKREFKKKEFKKKALKNH